MAPLPPAVGGGTAGLCLHLVLCHLVTEPYRAVLVEGVEQLGEVLAGGQVADGDEVHG